MSILCVVQARTASTRLPGKVLEVVAGESLVRHALKRAVFAARHLPNAVVMLATAAGDRDSLGGWVPHACPPVADGNVLGRFAWALDDYYLQDDRADPIAICRLTADNPLVNPDDIIAVTQAVSSGRADYASNVLTSRWCDGVDVEAFTADLLRRANDEATAPDDREHVTHWIIRYAERPWHVGRHVRGPMRRWTIDTAEDLAWFRRLAEHIEMDPANGRPTTDELLALLAEQPELERSQTDACPQVARIGPFRILGQPR